MNLATPENLAVLDHLLTSTRSVRKRLDLDRPVEREVIEQCLEIAGQGSHRQQPPGLALCRGDREREEAAHRRTLPPGLVWLQRNPANLLQGPN